MELVYVSLAAIRYGPASPTDLLEVGVVELDEVLLFLVQILLAHVVDLGVHARGRVHQPADEDRHELVLTFDRFDPVLVEGLTRADLTVGRALDKDHRVLAIGDRRNKRRKSILSLFVKRGL